MLYTLVYKLGWIDTYWGLVLSFLVMGFGIFFLSPISSETFHFLRQNIYSIPSELIDAARIDGTSELGIYLRIILPLSKNVLSALGIYAFTVTWGRLIWQLVVINSQEKFTTELGLRTLQRRFVVEYGPIMAAAVIILIPALIVFAILNQRIGRGMSLAGMKG